MPSRGPSKVHPQVVESSDGFPKANRRFCGEYDEMLAVAKRLKPIAVVSLGAATYRIAGYRHLIGHKCPVYDVSQVRARCSAAVLKHLPYADGVVIVYCPYTLCHAQLLQSLEKLSIPGNEFHIITGLLLGYQKSDIRAWHLAYNLTAAAGKDFLSHRSTLVRDPFVKSRAQMFGRAFEAVFDRASKRLEGLLMQCRNSQEDQLAGLQKYDFSNASFMTYSLATPRIHDGDGVGGDFLNTGSAVLKKTFVFGGTATEKTNDTFRIPDYRSPDASISG